MIQVIVASSIMMHERRSLMRMCTNHQYHNGNGVLSIIGCYTLLVMAVVTCMAYTSYGYASFINEQLTSIMTTKITPSVDIKHDNCSAPNDAVPLSYPRDMGIHWHTSGEWWNALVILTSSSQRRVCFASSTSREGWMMRNDYYHHYRIINMNMPLLSSFICMTHNRHYYAHRMIDGSEWYIISRGYTIPQFLLIHPCFYDRKNTI